MRSKPGNGRNRDVRSTQPSARTQSRPPAAKAPRQRKIPSMPTVFIPQPLRTYTDGKDRVDLPNGGSLRRVIHSLEAQYPGLEAQLLEDDAIRPGIAFFINDEQASEGLIQPVPDDATIHILPALGGGS